jgi:hypothetical protein
VTALVYHARENALELLRGEATRIGAERVIGNKLRIVELSPGLIEVMAIGTAVRRVEGMTPASPALMPQAIIVERDTIEAKRTLQESQFSAPVVAARRSTGTPRGCLITALVVLIPIVFIIVNIVFALVSRH